MTVLYRNYQDRAINELVFAGTHDAGINKGSGNEKTQDLDIGGQAAAGDRILIFVSRRARLVCRGPGSSRPTMERECTRCWAATS